MNIVGIYKITNPNGKIYIGQSINIEKRKKIYKNNYNDYQVKIYRSIKKYGWENHKFEIIEECEIEKLSEREIYWKKYYLNLIGWKNVLFCELYDKGEGPRSIETKNKISKSLKGRNITWNKKKPVLQYDLQGNFIKEWESGKEASIKLKIKRPDISNCCNNKKYTAGGYLWFHKVNFNKNKLLEKLKKLKNKYDNIKKPIVQLNIDGSIHKTYESYMEAKRQTKINNIEKTLSGKQKTAGGYIWKFKRI